MKNRSAPARTAKMSRLSLRCRSRRSRRLSGLIGGGAARASQERAQLVSMRLGKRKRKVFEPSSARTVSCTRAGGSSSCDLERGQRVDQRHRPLQPLEVVDHARLDQPAVELVVDQVLAGDGVVHGDHLERGALEHAVEPPHPRVLEPQRERELGGQAALDPIEHLLVERVEQLEADQDPPVLAVDVEVLDPGLGRWPPTPAERGGAPAPSTC